MPVKLITNEQLAANITCIISDVDGVLTDGRIIYDDQGRELKQFHARDGMGIKAWMRSGFAFAILSARNSEVVTKRAFELGITTVVQGAEAKWQAAESIFASLGCRADQVCYIGDDLPDIPVMRRVGLAVTPADASNDARDSAQWILQSSGGQGALRELIERLLRAKGRWKEHLQ